jgi:RNA polymerase sigma-70 factor (ECF subfamily)
MRLNTGAASSGDASAEAVGPSGALTPAEFSARLTSVSKTLWLIAAAVVGRRDEAEDIVQESAMIGLQKIAEFRPDTNFAAWMGGIVRNVARNAARKSQRRHTGATDPAALDESRAGIEPPPADPGFDRRGVLSPEQSDFDDRVIRALGLLEETPRVCLLLRSLRQMPYRDIATLLGIPEGTAMSHVHRARSAVRQELLKESGVHVD